MRMPCLRAGASNCALELRALGSGLLEARGDHHHAPTRFFAHWAEGARHQRLGHRDHREVDRVLDRRHAPVALDRVQHLGIRVDREDLALEAAGDQVVEHLPADGARPARGADDGHGTGPEELVETVVGAPGPRHRHPAGEVNFCIAVDGSPTFDGEPPGWVVLPPGSTHVPTVSGGTMLIVYLLPRGEMEFLK
jgi:hypothetical protein